jgi:hypothetical protein
MRTKEYYPEWICDQCGITYGIWYKGQAYIGPPSWRATYHMGKCQVCETENVPVTEPRDYGGLSHKEMREIHAQKKNRNTSTTM